MALPINVLLIAAQLAKSEQAKKLGRAILDRGSDALTKRLNAKPEPKAPAPNSPRAIPATESPPKTGWKSSLKQKMKFRAGQTGDLVAFEYRDEHGLITQRMVGNWRSDGRDLTGFCLNRKEECAFAVSGIRNPRNIEVGQ